MKTLQNTRSAGHSSRTLGGGRNQGKRLYKEAEYFTGPVQEKSTLPGKEACRAETVGSRSRKETPGPVQNN